ncbi:MAG: gamma carbonic anhydrase family protein [Desulfofustis sp.]|nr:gamma carbonic anhydrase family protein [Desulfofustis sp.]
MITSYRNNHPQLHETVYVAPGAWVIGRVFMGEDSSVYFNTVIRGDTDIITIGERTNIQDNSTIHVNEGDPVSIGSHVTVGHNAIVHGCTVRNRVLIGMGAIILDRAVIESDCYVAAGSLVAPGKTFPPGSMIMGSPAKVVRQLSQEEIDDIIRVAAHYVESKNSYK